MDKHIDVIGYLLVVIVFSVGFLMTRHQDYWHERLATVTNASWRVRDALARGDRVTAQDVAAVLLDSTADAVALVARLVNLVLVACALGVSVDAYRLAAGRGVAHPPDAIVLLAFLTVATVAVLFLGEYHVRSTTRKSVAAIHTTGAGKLQQISGELQRKEPGDVGQLLGELRATYPTWTLLDEMDAMARLVSGDAAQALAISRALADERPEQLSLTPAVAVAASLAIGEAQASLSILDAARRANSAVQYAGLRRGAGLAACELDQLVNPPQDGDRVRTIPVLDAGLSGSGGPSGSERLPVLLDPLQLEECRAVLSAVEAWDRDGEPPGEVRLETSNAAFNLVQEVASGAAPVDSLVERAVQDMSVPLYETTAVILLARGRGSEAIDLLIRAIELRPAEHRTQWLLGLCYQQSGWVELSEESFRNALQLAPPDHPLNALTMQLAGLADAERSELETSSLYWMGHGRYEELRLLATLAGASYPERGTPRSPRARFVDELVETCLGTRASTQGSPVD